MSSRLPESMRRVAQPVGAAVHQGRERWRRARSRDFSSLGEQEVLRRILGGLHVDTGFAVDIAACDGVTKSNARGLYEEAWAGLAVEGDPVKFASLSRAYRHLPAVSLARVWVTPDNVVPLLEAHGTPREFAFLNLDIDGYDHFVLEALLRAFRPALVCAEINEKVPPPVKFTVRYDPNYVWAEDHFYGQSISTLQELAAAFGYDLVELHYNNAFLVPAERSVLPALSAEDAYATGYLDRPDRLNLFPRNADMEELHALDARGKVAFLERLFEQYRGRYDIGL